jgi:hypothetical protein
MMYQEFFAGSDLLAFPLVALGIFFTVFLVVLARVAWGLHRRTRLDHMANLPLEPDSPPRPAGLAGREP